MAAATVMIIDRQKNPCASGGTTFAKQWSWPTCQRAFINLTIDNGGAIGMKVAASGGRTKERASSVVSSGPQTKTLVVPTETS
jgi:hypothetical protein